MALHNIDIEACLRRMADRLNTLGTNAIALPVARVDLETERGKLRARFGQTPVQRCAVAATPLSKKVATQASRLQPASAERDAK